MLFRSGWFRARETFEIETPAALATSETRTCLSIMVHLAPSILIIHRKFDIANQTLQFFLKILINFQKKEMKFRRDHILQWKN